LAPGSYATSSLSTVVNGLFVSGGPARTGSLRNVQLVRGGGPIATVDLYDFFLSGKRPGDLPLQNDDTIFVPPLGPVVGVVGNVLRPAIYEMKGDTTLRQALLMAGGVTPIAYTARVTIERVQPHDSSVALDLDIGPEGIEKSANPALDQRVTDYDLIRVRSIRQDLANAVTLRGHVVRPGVYQIKEGAKLADVLDSYDQLLFEPYLEHAEIRRLMPPDHHEETLSFNLGRLLDGDEAEDIGLQPHDVITIFSKDEMEARRIVSIDGEVRNAGAYQLLEGMRLKDLVYAAGNVTTQAYLAEAEVTRYAIDPDGSHMEAEHFEVSLKQAMLDDPKHNVALRPFDHVLVRGISEFDLADVIDLTGEFRYPGRYRVNRGERLSDVIERAGGFTERAYLPAAKLTRESVRKMQQARLQELIDRQEQELLVQSAREQDVVDPLKAQKVRESLELKEKLVDKLKNARVEGRVVIKLAELEPLRASEYDITVEPRDALYVPPRPTTIGVLGEVYNETSVLWEEDETVQHDLGTVGGAAPNADEDQMFVIKADGSVMAASQDHGG
ncbi:MAG: SLBB domain-containing protein, partial [Candidatus Methylomirabilis sp.]|nr:SLBB domain-containing protein [Deltaproteobacteria bacterium]